MVPRPSAANAAPLAIEHPHTAPRTLDVVFASIGYMVSLLCAGVHNRDIVVAVVVFSECDIVQIDGV